ncbi:MAG: PKD domain-containing protein [Euryarchaeota archaeon]|nr:PKD domain-containing protein [Euryarchaeota archaeon]
MNMKSLITVPVVLLLALLIVPVSAATTVSVSDVFFEPGDDATVSIVINNVSNLGVANINIDYDPSVVCITTVNNSDFDDLYPVIDNTIGLVKVGGVDYGDGLSGNVKLADLLIEAVGDACETSTLNLTVNELKEASATETTIPATVDSGIAVLNLPPVAVPRSLHRYNNIGDLGRAIFNGSASYDPSTDGSVINYGWNFGDGENGTGETVEHVYSSSLWNGTGYEPFEVCLTVNDNGDLLSSTLISVNVYIAGDVNGDGEVNILDAVLAGKYWRATCGGCGDYVWGDEGADRADLNNDCDINILDSVIIGANWRKTAW